MNTLEAWSSSDVVYFFKQRDEEWSEINTSYRSSILPSANSNTVALYEKDEVTVHKLELTKPDIVGPVTRSWQLSNGYHICIWEKVIFLLRRESVNQIQLVEYGPLDFALKFCKAMNNFYRAVCYIPPNSEEEKVTLKKVFLLAKSVPRNSTRTKWRETGNFQPKILGEGKLMKGDMVFHLNIESSLDRLIVHEDFSLTNSDKKS